MRFIIPIVFGLCFSSHLSHGQIFTLIADTANPIVAEPDCGTENNHNFNCFQGAAWVDLNKDSRLDLFYAGKLFVNQDSGKFVKRPGVDLSGYATQSSSVSFMDFDNDGDGDLLFFNGNGFGTQIFESDGNGNFRAYPSLLDSLNSTVWSAQWCDYNIDSHGDLILTFADGFAGNLHFPNRLFKGDGSGGFTQVQDTVEFLNALHPYTVSYWIDYDEDGDQDLFIASGPGSSTGPDFLYKNLIVETGMEAFEKATDVSFANQQQNGQCYNFVDADNDGDLDACLTNWRLVPNRFYENTNGTYTGQSTPFTANSNGFHLSNAWGDIDNDGDLDVLISATNQADAKYYLNNGDGTFSVGGDIGSLVNGPTSGLSLGDYDNDGFLDFFVTGKVKGLFRNNAANGNTFINLLLTGNPSNKSAIGARVKIKATINGQVVWQKREVSTQNTFMGHNSQRVHFGLGDATNVDSLIIDWPSGARDEHQHVKPGHFYHVQEGEIPFGILFPPVAGVAEFQQQLFSVHPNPGKGIFNVALNGPGYGNWELKLYNMAGQRVFGQTGILDGADTLKLDLQHLAEGHYTLELVLGQKTARQKVIIE